MLDYPQVALDFMNRDHAEFVALRQRLLDLLADNPPAADVDALLDELLQHSRHHFAEEERRMQAVAFPPYPLHKSEHAQVLHDMSARIADWQQTRDAAALSAWLEHDIGDWFVNHVSSMDLVTAGYIKAKEHE